MTLPVYPNSINLSNIQTEFGGSNPISLSEYYAGGSYVASGTIGYPGGNATNIPSSGQISFDNFHGAVRTYNVTISSDTADYNLMTALQNAGANISGTFRVNVTINAIVYSTSTGSPGFNTGPLSGGAVYITNNSYIVGKGGAGGTGALGGNGQRGTNGANGGLAFWAQTTTYFTNNGVIGGGGGGGGGGAGGDYDSPNPTGSEGYGGGGGGGAGFGLGGPVRPPGSPDFYAGQTAGGNGTYNSAGGGGSGGSYGGYGNDRFGWWGGAGGALGSSGQNGGGLGQPAGSGGAAVAGNGNITWITTGTRYGSIS